MEIPQGLYDRFAARAKERGFASPEAYLLWALERVADRLADGTPPPPAAAAPTYTPEQDAVVRDRLRSLGYID